VGVNAATASQIDLRRVSCSGASRSTHRRLHIRRSARAHGSVSQYRAPAVVSPQRATSSTSSVSECDHEHGTLLPKVRSVSVGLRVAVEVVGVGPLRVMITVFKLLWLPLTDQTAASLITSGLHTSAHTRQRTRTPEPGGAGSSSSAAVDTMLQELPRQRPGACGGLVVKDGSNTSARWYWRSRACQPPDLNNPINPPPPHETKHHEQAGSAASSRAAWTPPPEGATTPSRAPGSSASSSKPTAAAAAAPPPLSSTGVGVGTSGSRPASAGKQLGKSSSALNLSEAESAGTAAMLPGVGAGDGGGDGDETDEDADCCPTCLEVYTDGNPRTWTRCGHHFHLQCLYEWLERKDTCPLCESQVEFDELV